LQFWQATPRVPQAVSLSPGWHLLPAQQPLVHEVASHTQLPLTQCRPGIHGALPPHLQAPATQVSATTRSHEMQAIPFLPQVEALGVLQVVPEQHPPAQLVGEQLAQE